MDSNYILLARGIKGAYFVMSGTQEQMNKAMQNLKSLTLDPLDVVMLSEGYDIADLKEDATLFNKVYGEKVVGSMNTEEEALNIGLGGSGDGNDGKGKAPNIVFDDEDGEDDLFS